ncbi:hypothetical protein [Halorarius halobius]|uniref:hypothetical protein n=1 Tax=Halorarius halobius TaxID=2962671 RepID=UPI0020CE6E80|nr:hypothetical protein [Halorarius halobius]
MPHDREDGLTDAERARLAAFRSVESLAALADLLGVDDPHHAYFEAKREWRRLRDRELDLSRGAGVPGTAVVVDGHEFWVHGVTHAGTDAEREFLQSNLAPAVEEGAVVYCEQGIRPMYFDGVVGACAMDDYRWAMERCAELDADSHVADLVGEEFEGLTEDIDALTERFREAVFSLVEAGSDLYGDRFAAALGDVASEFLTGHAALAVGDEFESFRLTRAAAEAPARLVDLQRYYERAFLPQPLEREWLRRHDPELELVTHARNARMADYAVYHNDDAERVHLVVGAAHQPGVRYYLDRLADGERSLAGFEPL